MVGKKTHATYPPQQVLWAVKKGTEMKLGKTVYLKLICNDNKINDALKGPMFWMQEFQNTTVILLIYLQITNNSVKYFMVIILFILWVFLFTFVQKVFFIV